MPSVSLTSPHPPEFNEPWEFRVEWLQPTTKDVHSRSRSQSILLLYLRKASAYFAKFATQDPSKRDNELWKRYFETLKSITSMEICQPPPLRAALASLWTVYSQAFGNNSMIVTEGVWLLEQLRLLNNQHQASVYAECAASFFFQFKSFLTAMMQDCILNLIRLAQLNNLVRIGINSHISHFFV